MNYGIHILLAIMIDLEKVNKDNEGRFLELTAIFKYYMYTNFLIFFITSRIRVCA